MNLKRDDICFGAVIAAFFAGMIFVSLSGCGDGPFDQKYSAPPAINQVALTVVWVDAAKIAEVCKNQHAYACATIGSAQNPASTIYAMEPRSFSDNVRVEALGHELLHALGAKH